MSQTQLSEKQRKLIENAVKELGGDLVSIEHCSQDVVYIETTKDSGCFVLVEDVLAPGFPIAVPCHEYCKSMKEEEGDEKDEWEDEEEEELWMEFEEEWEQEDDEDEWEEGWRDEDEEDEEW